MTLRRTAPTWSLDQYAVPDTLMDEVGLMEWLRSDREMTDGDWLR